MTIRHFAVFKAVCDCGSITAAAEKLNISQPAVSYMIRELEDYYDTKLFERANRRIFLTESGHVLLSGVHVILAQYDNLPEMLRGEENRASFRIGVNVAVGETLYPKIRKLLMESESDIYLEEVIANTEAVITKLKHNELDFALVDRPHEPDIFQAYPLCSDDMRAVCADGYMVRNEIDIHELSGHTLLLRESGSESRACIEKTLLEAGVSQGKIIESVSTLGLINLARAEAGIVFLPESIAKEITAQKGMKLLTVRNAVFSRDYFLIHRKSKNFTKKQRQILTGILNDLEKSSRLKQIEKAT